MKKLVVITENDIDKLKDIFLEIYDYKLYLRIDSLGVWNKLYDSFIRIDILGGWNKLYSSFLVTFVLIAVAVLAGALDSVSPWIYKTIFMQNISTEEELELRYVLGVVILVFILLFIVKLKNYGESSVNNFFKKDSGKSIAKLIKRFPRDENDEVVFYFFDESLFKEINKELDQHSQQWMKLSFYGHETELDFVKYGEITFLDSDKKVEGYFRDLLAVSPMTPASDLVGDGHEERLSILGFTNKQIQEILDILNAEELQKKKVIFLYNQLTQRYVSRKENSSVILNGELLKDLKCLRQTLSNQNKDGRSIVRYGDWWNKFLASGCDASGLVGICALLKSYVKEINGIGLRSAVKLLVENEQFYWLSELKSNPALEEINNSSVASIKDTVLLINGLLILGLYDKCQEELEKLEAYRDFDFYKALEVRVLQRRLAEARSRNESKIEAWSLQREAEILFEALWERLIDKKETTLCLELVSNACWLGTRLAKYYLHENNRGTAIKFLNCTSDILSYEKQLINSKFGESVKSNEYWHYLNNDANINEIWIDLSSGEDKTFHYQNAKGLYEASIKVIGADEKWISGSYANLANLINEYGLHDERDHCAALCDALKNAKESVRIKEQINDQDEKDLVKEIMGKIEEKIHEKCPELKCE